MSQGTTHEDEVRWSQVEDAFFVGNHRGNFVGYIEKSANDTYRTFDETSRPQGEARTLEQSMACLNDLYFAAARTAGDR